MGAPEYLPVQILHDFVKRIETIGLRYMLTGSMAMMEYGMYRQTADIDFVVELERLDLEAFQKVMAPDYYVPVKAMRHAVSSRRVFNVINFSNAFKVDCAIKKNTEFHVHAFERRRQTDFYGKTIWIISCEDLILSKLEWAKDSRSEKQMSDVVNIMSFGFDAEYAEDWVERLGIAEIYFFCKAESLK